MTSPPLQERSFRSVFGGLLLALVLLLVLPFSSGKAEIPDSTTLDVTTSPIEVEWDQKAQDFRFFFSITNNKREEAKLSAILLLEGRQNRWRGVRLPSIQGKTSMDFTFNLPASFILRQPFKNLVLKVYNEDYTALADKSSKYQKLSFSFIRGQKVVIKDRLAKGFGKKGKKRTEIKNFNLGSKAKVSRMIQSKRDETIKEVGVYIDGKLTKIKADTIFTSLPAPFLVVTGGNEKVLLSFNKISGADYYNIYWDTSPGVTPSTGQKISGVLESYLHRGLTNGKPHYYVITAVKDGNEGELSDEAIVIPNPRPPRADEPELKEGDSKIRLEWEPQEGALGYNLRWSRDKDLPMRKWKVKKKVKPGYEHRGLTNGVTYYYRLYGYNQFGEGSPSEIVEATPSLPKVVELSVPELLADIDISALSLFVPDTSLSYEISDPDQAQAVALEEAKELKAMDLESRERQIALFVAGGKTEALTAVLNDQLAAEPENINLSLSLSKVYLEQGNTGAALDVLNASLNRISFSARLALNQELKTQVKAGETQLSGLTEEAFLAEEFARLGLSLLGQTHYPEALGAFQSLQGLVPDYPLVEFNLGRSRVGMEQYNQAKEHFLSQMEGEMEPKDRFENLHVLSEVLPKSPDLKTIKNAIAKYEWAQSEGVPQGLEKRTGADLNNLKKLLAETEYKIRMGLPDLMIEFSAPFLLESLQPGNEFYLGFLIKNQGKKPSSSFKVSYMLQHEEGASFEIKLEDLFEKIEPGAEPFSYSKRLIIPENAMPGKYRLIANVQQTEPIGEINLENNKLVSELAIGVIEPAPDVKLNLAEIPDKTNIRPAQPLNLQVTPENVGGLRASAFTIHYFLQEEGEKPVEIGEADEVKNIQKRQEAPSIFKSLIVPEDLKEGRYQLILEARMDETSKDANPENNKVSSGYVLQLVPPGLDLALKMLDQPGKRGLKPGGDFRQRFEVKNIGVKDSGEVLINFTLKSEEGLEIGLGEYRLDEVEAKDSEDWEQKLTLPAEITHGNYQLLATLSTQGEVQDQNPANDQTVSGYKIEVGELEFKELAEFEDDTDRLLSRQTENEIYKHLPALALSLTSLMLSNQESVGISEAQNDLSLLQASYATATTQAELDAIDQSILSLNEEIGQRTNKKNLYDGLLLIGLGWEAYNIWWSDEAIDGGWGDWLPKGFWKHAGAIALIGLSYSGSQAEQQAIDQLQGENRDLWQSYPSATTSQEVQAIDEQINANNDEILTHVNMANFYDLATLVALGWEAWMIYDQLENGGLAQSSPFDFQVKPDPMKRMVELSWEMKW